MMSRLVPKLRFKEFSGELKEHLFNDIFIFTTGKNIKQNEASPEYKIPCIRYGELYHMYNEVIYKIINKTNLNKSELVFSKGNEILLPSAGEDPLDIGLSSALTIDNIAIGRTINILRPLHNNIYNQIFVSYYINQKLRREISKLAKGSTISNVYNSDLKKLKIVLPKLLEQKKIAQTLTSLDNLIEAQNKKVEALKNHKKGLMQRLFPKDGEKVPELRFDGFFREWEERKLEGVSKFINEKIQLNKISLTNYISTENILADFGGISKSSKLPNITNVTKFQKHDVLMSNIRPYLKKIWLANIEGGASNDIIIIRAKEGINYKFVFYIVQNDKYIDYVMQGAKGVKMPRGDILLIKKYPLALPKPKEQQKIADCLSSLDNLIEAQNKKVEALVSHKKGLMQRLFVSSED
jgi:type I restriction enzyme S subunit